MENLLAEISGNNFVGEIFSNTERYTSPTVDFCLKRETKPKSLTSCIQYLSKINDVENDLSGISFGFQNIIINDELSNKKVRQIALELAEAIDKNADNKVKELKIKYGNEKEFTTAKKFLNQKCKEVWDVFNSKNKKLNIPYKAMKALGITNQPSLEFLLANSLNFYEKNNTNATSQIISNILNNENLTYKIEEIHTYLKKSYEKDCVKCNLKTVEYLITKQNYDKQKLEEIGIEKDILKELSLKTKFKYLSNTARINVLQIGNVVFETINNIKSFRRF